MTCKRQLWDCKIGTPDEDHDFVYDPGEPDVGIPPCYVCRACGKVDESDREPPGEDLQDTYDERNR